MSQASVHPKWLNADDSFQISGDEQVSTDTIRYQAFMQLIRSAGALDRAATETLSDLHLTAGAYGALVELAEAGEAGIAPSELARRLAVARRTATLYIDILARQEWVSRDAHPEDRRMVLARLTAEGSALLEQVGRSYEQRLSHLLGDMSIDQALTLQELLTIIPTDRDHVADH